MTVKKSHWWVLSCNSDHKSGGHVIRKGANDGEAAGEGHKHPDQLAVSWWPLVLPCWIQSEPAQSSPPASLSTELSWKILCGKEGNYWVCCTTSTFVLQIKQKQTKAYGSIWRLIFTRYITMTPSANPLSDIHSYLFIFISYYLFIISIIISYAQYQFNDLEKTVNAYFKFLRRFSSEIRSV